MHNETPRTGLQLRSMIRPEGVLELSLVSVAIPEPAPDEVIVRIEATPINPSDLVLLFGAADMGTAKVTGTAASPLVTASIPEKSMKAMSARFNESLSVGNEGAGVVVAAGSSDAARALLGKTVGLHGGGMYAQYRSIKAEQCLLLPEGTSPAQGAASHVNPMTALSMVETMRREGHTALVHTAAASNLGQMLNRICLQDGIGLVNVVRKQEQKDMLLAAGAIHVCDSSAPTFLEDLTDAMTATGATIAFDALGGGRLAGQILTSMEAALGRNAKEFNRYGSSTHKQVYVYGGLDSSPTELVRNFGLAWGLGGWLLTPFLKKIGPAATQALRARVMAELTTTFASHYAKEVSLAEALSADSIATFGKRTTGTKYLINPTRDVGSPSQDK